MLFLRESKWLKEFKFTWCHILFVAEGMAYEWMNEFLHIEISDLFVKEIFQTELIDWTNLYIFKVI